MVIVFDNAVRILYLGLSVLLFLPTIVIRLLAKRLSLFRILELPLHVIWIVLSVAYVRTVGVQVAISQGMEEKVAMKFNHIIKEIKKDIEQDRKRRELGL